MVEAAVHRGHAAAGVGAIHHVVVHQRGGMDHLGDLGQAAMARAELTIRRHRPRQQQDDAGPQALAPGGKQMFSCRLQNWMTSADQTAQIGQQGIEVGLDRLEQLGDRRHMISWMKWILEGSWW